MAIRAVIIDDEPDAISVLKQLLTSIEGVDVIGTATSANAGIELIQAQNPELVFLDVEMPQKNGFHLLEAFPNPSFRVIFATAFDQYSIQAIRHSALDYLVKPIDARELAAAVLKAQEFQQFPDNRYSELQKMVQDRAPIDRIIIPSKKGFQVLLTDQICSIEAVRGNYAFFTLTSGKRYLCTKALSHYESMLNGTSFFRIHRSCIVNINKVSQYDSNTGNVTLSDNLSYLVATRRQAAFRRKMQAH